MIKARFLTSLCARARHTSWRRGRERPTRSLTSTFVEVVMRTLLLFCLMATFAGGERTTAVDAGPPIDGGTDIGDAGTVDAGPPIDGGTDIGHAGTVNDGDVGDDAAWPTLHVLFIGDSLTYVNDLPG